MRVALLGAKCEACQHEFACPQLGDFSYGAAVFSGERGTVHAYFDATSSPVFSFLSESFLNIKKPESLYAACAHFADAIEGQRLSDKMICPWCFSRNMDWWGGDSKGSVELPEVSFHRFMALPEAEREKAAEEYFDAGGQ